MFYHLVELFFSIDIYKTAHKEFWYKFTSVELIYLVPVPHQYCLQALYRKENLFKSVSNSIYFGFI